MRAVPILSAAGILILIVLVSAGGVGSSTLPVRGAGVLYVDDSSTNGLDDGSGWADAYVHLQDALANASTNGAVSEIWVAEGTYKPDRGRNQTPGDRNASFHLIAGVGLYGGFAGGESSLDERDVRANPTALSGDLMGNDGPGMSNGSDNSRHVIAASAASPTTMLDGLIIRDGRAEGVGDSAYGGGIFIAGGAAAVLHCRFERNSAALGGALYVRGGSVSLLNCVFAGNRGHVSGASRSPLGQGGAIFNTGGGVVSITQCVFRCNVADRQGGAVYNQQGCATITNSTMSGNTGSSAGGVTTTSSAVLAVQNSILWGNSDGAGNVEGSQITRSSSSAVLGIEYSCIQGWTGSLGGSGNHGGDPRFLRGPANGLPDCGDDGTGSDFDLRPAFGSSTIDAGDNAIDADACASGVQSLPLSDLAGGPRFTDDSDTPDTGVGPPPIVDPGAFEYRPGDCNYSGVPDADELLLGTSVDCDTNGVLDACQAPAIVPMGELALTDAQEGDHLGEVLAIDGDTLVTTLSYQNSAHVFRRTSEGWVEETQLAAPDLAGNGFGAVAISGDTVVLGAEGQPSAGAAYVFRRINGSWVYQARLDAPDGASSFGYSVALDGDLAIVGAPWSGASPSAAYVFRHNGANWVREARLTRSDEGSFGLAVAVSGDTLVVAGAGATFVYAYDGLEWREQAMFLGRPPVAVSGKRFVTNAPVGTGSHAVQVFRRDVTAWSLETVLRPIDGRPDDFFGESISISGDLILVGAGVYYSNPPPTYGAAYLFRHNGAGWAQEARLAALDAQDYHRFGTEVGVNGHTAVVSAPNDSDAAVNAGSLYVFEIQRDCDGDGRLDACDMGPAVDCNRNLAPDSCDIASGRSDDCDRNGTADECDIALSPTFDCNHNSAPDSCDVGAARSVDSNTNGVPDECEVDCNSNGVPDDADLIAGTSQDCNINGTPDECETDCNHNAVPDDCDLTSGTSPDCNENNVPDECDIGLGTSFDCELSGTPDECEIDCNSNGRHDACDFAGGTSNDCDSSGVPDECELFSGQQEAKLVAADAAAQDDFGLSVSLSGNRAVVGAYLADEGANDSGAAYIFRRAGGSWVQEAKLVAADGALQDFFGWSSSISGDRALVGARWDDNTASNSGSAYVFRRDGGTWTQEAKLVAADGALNDQFGISVSLSGDRALVGAYQDNEAADESGSAYVFRREGNAWAQEAKLAAADGAVGDHFGVSVSVDGDRALIGAFGDWNFAGSAYVFRRDGGTWTQEAKLVAADAWLGDRFGASVSLSGDRALVGAYQDDDAADDSGSAYVFRREGDAWVQEAKLVAADGAFEDGFGGSVSLSGDRALVGAAWDNDAGSNAGSAYVFQRAGSTWVPLVKLVAAGSAGNDYFGLRVSLNGGSALIGASGDDDAGTDSGSAYAYLFYGDCNANGVPDDCDVAAETTSDCNHNSIPDECEGIVRADLDCDGYVDTRDFTIFSACHPTFGQAIPPGCDHADVDRDGDVDCADWRILRDSWTAGPPPAYPRCRTPSGVVPAGGE